MAQRRARWAFRRPPRCRRHSRRLVWGFGCAARRGLIDWLPRLGRLGTATWGTPLGGRGSRMRGRPCARSRVPEGDPAVSVVLVHVARQSSQQYKNGGSKAPPPPPGPLRVINRCFTMRRPLTAPRAPELARCAAHVPAYIAQLMQRRCVALHGCYGAAGPERPVHAVPPIQFPNASSRNSKNPAPQRGVLCRIDPTLSAQPAVQPRVTSQPRSIPSSPPPLPSQTWGACKQPRLPCT